MATHVIGPVGAALFDRHLLTIQLAVTLNVLIYVVVFQGVHHLDERLFYLTLGVETFYALLTLVLSETIRRLKWHAMALVRV